MPKVQQFLANESGIHKSGLDRLAHSPGAIDGKWGVRTARALKQSLSVNGRSAALAPPGPLPGIDHIHSASGDSAMKSLSPALQAHLDDGITTRSWCWRITHVDGVTLGFTDHDAVLTFDGTDFEPESGFAASEIRSGSDLSVDAQDAEGVLTADRITKTDIIDGRWDSAQVELWRVNWAATSQRVLMRLGAVGQIRRGRMAVVADPRAGNRIAASAEVATGPR